MKKFLFMALCGGALLAACSNDAKVDEPNNPSSQIAFTTFVNKASKATPTTVTELQATGFKVWGYNSSTTNNNPGTMVLTGVDVSWRPQENDWNYSPVAYWIKSTDYWFSAVNDGLTITGLTASSYGHFTFNQGNPVGDKDVVWATAHPNTTPATIENALPKVEFTFKHALCRVKFTFNFTDPNTEYSIAISDLKLSGTKTSGKFTLATAQDLSTGTWSDLGASCDAPYTDFPKNNGAFAPSTAVTSEYKYLVPGNFAAKDATSGDKLTASFVVTLYQTPKNTTTPIVQASYTHTATPIGQQAVTFEQGHSYNITTTLTANGDGPNIDPDHKLFPIEFNVTDVTNYGSDEPVTW